MVRYLWFGILSLLSATSALAQSCTAANARSIDLDVAFLAYWDILVVSWAAIAAFGKRSSLPPTSLNKRDLVCTSSELCLSFKGYPFCDNPSTHNFHIADGTTGNFLTGEYTLADGRQGNMYHGPYPTNTIAAAAATQTGSTAVATVSTVTVTGASSVGTPVVNSAGPSTTVSQQEVISSQVDTTTATKPSVTSTPSSSTVLKSDGSWIGLNLWPTGSRIVIITLFGFFLYM